MVFGEDNFVVTRVGSVCVSDVGDVTVVFRAPEDADIAFVVTRVVVVLVV